MLAFNRVFVREPANFGQGCAYKLLHSIDKMWIINFCCMRL